MNGTILNEIKNLRKIRRLGTVSVNKNNRNRYRLLVDEDNGTSTSYYFSTPIYNKKGWLVKRDFQERRNILQAEGSNAEIRVSGREIKMSNDEGMATLLFEDITGSIITSDKIKLLQTLNGIVIKASDTDGEISFRINTNKIFAKLRNNTKCFSIMNEDFRPYLTVSVIGVLDASGKVCRPAKIACQKIDDQNYMVRIFDEFFSDEGILMFEVNLYESKIFQDTTVESKHPGENNAFGSMGFIGRSEVFGQQWLYSRLDIANLPEILNMEINRAILHIPKYNSNSSDLQLIGYGISRRFCSFGSNWDNRIHETGAVTEPKISAKYCSFDITELIAERETGGFKNSEGLIVKANLKANMGRDSSDGYIAIATGDNYYTPQILEISNRI